MTSSNKEVRIVRPDPHLVGKTDPSKSTYVFCHVGKTGGTTFRAIMSGTALAQRREHRIVLGTIDEAIKKVESFGNSSQNVRYLMGHFMFGSIKVNDAPHIYLALVRDPVARMISQIKMLEQRRQVTIETISQEVNESYPGDNFQTRMLSGDTDFSAPCTRHTLEKAITNLEANPCLIGTTERFDQFVSKFLSLVGGPSVMYGKNQVSSAEIPEPRLTDLKEQIMERDTLDIELVGYIEKNRHTWNSDLLENAAEPRTSDMTICAVPQINLQDSRIVQTEDPLKQDIFAISTGEEPALLEEIKKYGYSLSGANQPRL